jgi:UDP-N-acetylmuramoylalanine--D-glutamate ligase
MPQAWLTTPIDYRDRRVTVMGLGAFGGGEGAVRFLAERGGRVTVTDLRDESTLAEPRRRLDGLPNVEWRLGRHEEQDFRGIDLLVVNPAVPRDSRYLRTAVESGVPLTSELNLFWLHNRARVIGVTGTNGKSTTASLIHAVLTAGGIACRLGGNIGRSLLPEVDEIGEQEWIILELSSFQLADLDHLQRSPHVAVVTNFAPNHLDRHASIDEYRDAKQAILRWQAASDVAVLNGDDHEVSSWPVHGRRLVFGESSALPIDAVTEETHVRGVLDHAAFHLDLADHPVLPGRHNRSNVAAAALASLAAGARPGDIIQGVESYPGLPHRLQFVAEVDGRRFYNDSKATTPEAAIAALQAFEGRGIMLLAGGSDKHVDLGPFAQAIAQRTKGAALMGETAEALEAGIRASMRGGTLPLHRAASLDNAVSWALSHSDVGDVVLLSPGCASLDWFANYEDRGEQFARVATSSAPAERRG